MIPAWQITYVHTVYAAMSLWAAALCIHWILSARRNRRRLEALRAERERAEAERLAALVRLGVRRNGHSAREIQ